MRTASRRRALVVEADSRTRQICERILESCGAAVDVTESGVTALTMARRKRPDIAIVDSQLRDCTGLEFVRWLRSNATLKSVPIIVLSISADDLDKSRGLDIRAVLTKPISPDAMMAAVREVLHPTAVQPTDSLGGQASKL